MKKQIALTLWLVFAGVCGIYGQVLIGPGRENLHKAAALELKSETGREGLLMPRVALTSATIWAPVDGNAVNGMIVYNSNNTKQNGLNGKGLYTWTDGRWYIVSSPVPCIEAPQDPVLKINGSDKKDLFVPLLLYVDNPEAGTSYEWNLPAGLIGHSNSNVITVIGSGEGTYTVTVQASNECGKSNVISQKIIIEKEIMLPAPDQSGHTQIQGVTCYDTAQTDDTGGPCGSLASRRPAFPDSDASKRTRPYTFSIQDNTGMSNLRIGYIDDADGIIKSVSGSVPGTLTLNAYPISVVFADDINSIVKGKGVKSTATLYAVYTENGTEKCILLTITVQDCACCPLDYAKIVKNAAYQGADVVYYAPNVPILDQLKHFQQIPNSALCVWNENQGDSVPRYTNRWPDAQKFCTETMAVNYGDGWRLPNIAEMYYNLHRIFYDDGGNRTSSRQRASRFMSSTAQRFNRDNLMYTRIRWASPSVVEMDGSTLYRYSEIGGYLNYRCVKTIDY
ncbi:MAG: hypothetical protein LBL79_09110 [Prevotella sp.]|jgi:hypothetical protein|nr:hypothetical protein [Prevotella sp.]